MTLTRRRFLSSAGGAAGLYLLSPIAARVGRAAGLGVDPATAARRRLVVIGLGGGNDGLNTVIPIADVAGAARASVYRKVRPSIAYRPEQTLPLDRPGDVDHGLGLNASMPYVHGLYKEGRVAIVQGVDYPNHSYSHFTSTDIWHSGEPEQGPQSGWVGRHLDRSGAGEGELRAVGVGYRLPLLLRGEARQGMGLINIPATRFADGAESDEIARARHNALTGFGDHPSSEVLASSVGRGTRATVGLVRELEGTTVPASTGDALADSIITARILLERNLGVETVYLEHPGFDTHTTQRPAQEALLGQLDRALRLFWTGRFGETQVLPELPAGVADRTMVMTISEFGRRIGEAGAAESAGTDHGAASPVFLVGPAAAGSRLVGGLHGEHPNMGTPTLPADDLMMTTDLRRLCSSVLTNWLSDPDPLFRHHAPLPGLFR
ncbi:MAG TPA: DUF1501 domain-containing protein [Acidimicrobiales bacterium]|nr:DUF1501 domain-containing protein [Acidimicrobiales bacterium]